MGKQDRCVACKIDISVISNLLYLRNKIGGCETNVNLSSKIFDHRDESNISRSEHGEIISHFALHSLQFITMASEPSSATMPVNLRPALLKFKQILLSLPNSKYLH